MAQLIATGVPWQAAWGMELEEALTFSRAYERARDERTAVEHDDLAVRIANAIGKALGR